MPFLLHRKHDLKRLEAIAMERRFSVAMAKIFFTTPVWPSIGTMVWLIYYLICHKYAMPNVTFLQGMTMLSYLTSFTERYTKYQSKKTLYIVNVPNF